MRSVGNKTLSIILSFFMVLGLIAVGSGSIKASAVTAYEILNKLTVVDSSGVQGTYGNLKPGSTYTNGECWQYVKDLSTYVYGSTQYIPNTASYLNGTNDEYWNVKAPVKNCSYEAIVNLLKGNAQPGDLICLRNSKVDQTYGHIMFVGSVTNTKITVYQAASGYARKDTVDLSVSGLQNLYSFGYGGQASFYGTNYGVALFRNIRRTENNSYDYGGGGSSQLFTTSGITLPSGKITQGNDFNVSGMVYCTKSISWINLAVEDQVTHATILEPSNHPYTNSYNIANFNSAINFGTLSPGKYRAVLKAGCGENGDEYMQGIKSDFEVVSSDTTKPTITNVEITNKSSQGFRVQCKVSDNVGVTQVKFPTWTAKNGQDDLIWHVGTKSGNLAYYDVKFSDHNNEKGSYITHIYAYDAAGNTTSISTGITVDENGPVISEVTITNITPSGYNITCTVEDDTEVSYVAFPTWSQNNGQDDLGTWPTGDIYRPISSIGNKPDKGTATYTVKVSEHKNDLGMYNTHIYAYDVWGNVTVYKANNIYVPSSSELYKITYDANGGTGVPSPNSDYVNVKLSNTKPTRNGYTFLGWSTSSSATTAQYQPGETISPGKSITLYAVWKLGNYTLTYSANGGKNPPANQTGNGNITLSNIKPTRDGYTFKNWNTKSDGTGTSYNPGTTYNLTANATLYAIWQKNETPDNPPAAQPTIQIKNYVSTKSVSWRATLKLDAVVENAPDGAEVHWFYNGEDKLSGVPCYISNCRNTFTIQAKLISKDGEVLAESEIETVTATGGFFAKLIAFFKGLFGLLPVIEQ